MDNKVTKESIEAKIANVGYMQLGKKTTLAIVTLKNGYEIIGASACVDPANFDAKIGREFALENAINKLWPLEAYLLQEKLGTAKPLGNISHLQPHQQRVVEELHDLNEKIAKLSAFMARDDFEQVAGEEADMLHYQIIHMRDYSNILADRVGLYPIE